MPRILKNHGEEQCNVSFDIQVGHLMRGIWPCYVDRGALYGIEIMSSVVFLCGLGSYRNCHFVSSYEYLFPFFFFFLQDASMTQFRVGLRSKHTKRIDISSKAPHAVNMTFVCWSRRCVWDWNNELLGAFGIVVPLPPTNAEMLTFFSFFRIRLSPVGLKWKRTEND